MAPSPQQALSSQGVQIIPGVSSLIPSIVYNIFQLLLLCGDIELNPGPPKKPCQKIYKDNIVGLNSKNYYHQITSNHNTGSNIAGNESVQNLTIQVEKSSNVDRCVAERNTNYLQMDNSYRVFYIDKIKRGITYKVLYETFNLFGQIEKIVLKYFKEKWSCMILYLNAISAASAAYAVSNWIINDVLGDQISCKVFHLKEFGDPIECFKPSDYSWHDPHPRISDKPSWFVGKSEPGKYQHHKVCKFIDLCVGKFIKVDIKRYGKDQCLINAKTPMQQQILESVALKSCDPLISIEPHKSFNNFIGVIYSQDLFQLDEQALIECPPEVISIERLCKNQPLLKLKFKGPGPYYNIEVDREIIKVQPYKSSPIICKNCFRYRHTQMNCRSAKACENCGAIAHGFCRLPSRCLHCGLNHKSNDRNCPFYKHEVEILAYANTEHISINEARRLKNTFSTN